MQWFAHNKFCSQEPAGMQGFAHMSLRAGICMHRFACEGLGAGLCMPRFARRQSLHTGICQPNFAETLGPWQWLSAPPRAGICSSSSQIWHTGVGRRQMAFGGGAGGWLDAGLALLTPVPTVTPAMLQDHCLSC